MDENLNAIRDSAARSYDYDHVAVASARDASRRTSNADVRKRSKSSINLAVEEELHILRLLRASISAHNEVLNDPELMLILADGETSLLEFLDVLLEADLEDDGLIAGLKQSKDTLAVRLHRLEERRQSRRAVLEQALFLLERKTLERPTATITLVERAPALIVEEEAQIPALTLGDTSDGPTRALRRETEASVTHLPNCRCKSFFPLAGEG